MPFPAFVAVSFAIAAATVGGAWALSRRPQLVASAPAVLRGVPPRTLGVGAAALGAAVLLLLHGPLYFDCLADDAFITFRYSEHLAQGAGPNWNSEGRVEGYTSFLWMVTLAAPARLDIDLVDASRALAFVALLATFLSVFLIWRLWRDDDGESGIDTAVVPAAVFAGLALTDGTAFWGFSGMETPVFTALLTGGAYLHLRERRGARVPYSALAFAAAAMTRPEGLIAAAVTGAFVALPLLQRPRARDAVFPIAWLAVFVLLYGSYFAWRFAYYDHLLPNTFYAKAGLTSASFERGLDYVWTYGLRYHLLPLAIGLGALAARPRLTRDAAYIAALAAALLLGVVIEGGDAFGQGRFIMPFLPLVYLGGLAGYATLLRRLDWPAASAGAIAAAGLALTALSLYPGTADAIPCRRVDDIEQRRDLGEWLTANTPADYTVAAFAVGALGYHTDRDMLDLLGINDVTIAHTDVPDLGRGLQGHEKYNVDYTLDVVRPEIIVPSDAEPAPFTTEELRARFSIPSPIAARNALLQDSRLWERYEARSVQIEGRWYNFLQRRDTAGELQAPGLR